MIVFIFGGSKQHYLSTQVELSRQNVSDCEDIVYVSGPVSASTLVAGSATHVHPSEALTVLNIENTEVPPMLKHFRTRALINHICAKYLTKQYGLFLHGDTFPVATIDEKILLDNHLSAGVKGHSVQWCLTRKGIGHSILKRRNVKLWPLEGLKLGDFNCQSCSPGFVHLDDMATDDDETMRRKLDAFRLEYMSG